MQKKKKENEKNRFRLVKLIMELNLKKVEPLYMLR